MSYRQRLDQLVKISNFTTYTLAAILIALLVFGHAIDLWIGSLNAVVCFVILLLASLILITRSSARLRCPSCSTSLVSLLASAMGFKMPAKIRYCPHCGISFDIDPGRH